MRARTTLAAGLFAFGLAASTDRAAAIDTIDCGMDRGAAERTICSSQHLQILDAQITEAYADIMHDSTVSARTKSLVHESQLSFLERRNACGDDRSCLSEVMERRVTRIAYYR